MTFFELWLCAAFTGSVGSLLLCATVSSKSFWLYALLVLPLTICTFIWWLTLPLVPDASKTLSADTAFKTMAIIGAALWLLMGYLLLKRWRSWVVAIGGGFVAALCAAFTLPVLGQSVLGYWYSPAGQFVAKVQNATPQQQRWLQRFVESCPGVDKYAPDIEWAKVASADEDGFFRVEYKIADLPTVLPAPLNKRSAGHQCYLNMDVGRLEAAMGKRACHSMCVGQWRENQPNHLGWQFALSPL